MFGLFLNATRTELRHAARIEIGIEESLKQVKSFEFLSALTNDPDEARAQHERMQANAKLEAARSQPTED